MRSAIFVILTAIGLAGLFVAYWVMQPVTPVSAKSGLNVAVPPPPKKTGPDENNGIRAGDNPRLRQYDNKGQLSSEFSGDQYHPRSNGTIDVVNPVAIFYLANNQQLRVTGKRGNVVMKKLPNPGVGGFANAAPMSPPSTGRLDDVTVELIDENRPPGNQIAMTMKTNNTVFDNETYNIFTQGYRDEQGRDIAADQVPVTITGDIELKGRGLKVRWNDNDGRLELLEIAHGQLLIVKQSSMAHEKKPKSQARSAEALNINGLDLHPLVMNSRVVGPRLAPPLPAMLAGQDQKSAGEVITSYRPPSTQPKTPKERSGSSGPVIYDALFLDNVRINQLDPTGAFDQLLIDNVDRMNVHFRLKQSGEKGPATQNAAETQAATAPPSNPKEDSKPFAPPPVTMAPTQTPTSTGAPAPSIAATQSTDEKDSEQPVYIRWTGMLRITPITTAPYVPLKPGDSAVKLVGEPVQVHRIEPKQQGAQDIRSTTVLYASAGDNVWLDCSPKIPQILIDRIPDMSTDDQRVTHLVSMGQVHYMGSEHLARLMGPGNADIPLAPEAGSPSTSMRAAWSKLAEFDFSAIDPQGQPVVKSAQFQGDVDIAHPKLNLRSQSLLLGFGTTPKPPVVIADSNSKQKQKQKPQSQTTLESVVATTGVNCELLDPAGKKTIDADKLVLETATSEGKLYPRHLHATGSVHAHAEDDLKSDVLDVLLQPLPSVARTTKVPRKDADSQNASVDLQEMIATGHVITKSKDGSTAIGDRLVVRGPTDKTHAILTSAAYSKVIDAKGNFVTGPHIEFNSSDGRAYIVGPGELYAMKQESTTQPSQPLHVNWTTGAQFDGALNRIDADGSITADSTDSRGFINTALGDHIRIDLRTKPPVPTTQPVLASAKQKAKPPTSAPADPMASGIKMDLFKDKEVVAMTLLGNADMKSTLYGPDRSILQQMVLDGPQIILQELGPDGTKSMTVTVPAAGKMLVRDYRSAVISTPTAKDSTGDSQGQGTTFFNWQKSMVYNDAAHRADMDGQVRIIHVDREQGVNGEPVETTADHVTAWFEPAPGKKPDAQPKPGPSSTTAVAAKAPTNPKNSPPAEDSHIQLKHVTAFSAQHDFVVVTHGEDELHARQIDYDPKTRIVTAKGSPQNPVYFVNAGTMQTTADQIDWDTVTWRPQFKNATVDFRPAQPGAVTPKPKPKPLLVKPGDRRNQ